MQLPRYNALANTTHTTYEFLSSGKKGIIKKVLQYTEIAPGVFNLGFGDWDEIKQVVKDHLRTNNCDREKVMGINSNWHEISQLFEIMGFANNNWETFKQGKNYEAFALKAQ